MEFMFALLIISSLLIIIIEVLLKDAETKSKGIFTSGQISALKRIIKDNNDMTSKNSNNTNENKKICKKCGTYIDADSSYCKVCGKKQK